MKKILTISLVIGLLAFSACGKKKEAGKSIEQLQKEKGIPVRTATIEAGTFSQELSYNATLSGAEEADAMALMSDVIIKINAKVGDRVSRGQTIVVFPRTALEARNDQAQTAFDAAKMAYDRMRRLVAQGAISQQDMDNVETQFKMAQSALDSSNQMINITAPISGVITKIMVNQGDRTYPGQPLFTVASASAFKAILNVPEMDVKSIRKGTAAVATWNKETLNGRVSSVALGMDQKSKAFRVECQFPNNNRNFSYGVTAEIKLKTLSKADCIIIDRQNIVTENGKKYVWLAENGKAKKVEIQTGLDNHLSFEVTEGLNPGDIIITEGISLLTEGAKILVTE